MKLLDFYKALFNEDESTCWSQNPYGTAVHPMSQYETFHDCNYFSINPMTGRRLDMNVTAYRNILLEFDEMSISEQQEFLKTVPHTTLVYSGGKSLHAIISLAEPCQTREEYDLLVRRIYDRVPGVDTQAKNPSRFSRAPGAMRNGVEQRLMAVGNRITRVELEAFLGPDAAPQPAEYTQKPGRSLKGILRGSTAYFLAYGAQEGSWNKELFLSALDMSRNGHDELHIYKMLTGVTGRLTASDRRTIASAIKIAERD